MKYNKNDLTGQKFGRLLVLEETDKRADRSSIVWKCKCDCGNIVEVSSKRLVSHLTLSCGCYQKERQRYSIKKLQEKQFVENTNIDLIKKKDANSNSKTGVRGVHYDKTRNMYKATLNFQNKLVLNKRFDTLEEAVRARKEAEEKYFKPILDKYKAE